MRKDARLGLSLLASLLVALPLHAESALEALPDEGSDQKQMMVASSHDYSQPEPAADDDEQGKVINEDEQQTIQNDQEQFEQEHAALNPLDKNNDIRNRVQQDEAKLEKDMQAGNNPAVEEDQTVLKVDRQELHEKDTQEANLSKELSEYHEPAQNKVLSSNTSHAASPTTSPENAENKVPNQEQENLQQYQSPPEATPRQSW